jgi:hypothetical protein
MASQCWRIVITYSIELLRQKNSTQQLLQHRAGQPVSHQQSPVLIVTFTTTTDSVFDKTKLQTPFIMDNNNSNEGNTDGRQPRVPSSFQQRRDPMSLRAIDLQKAIDAHSARRQTAQQASVNGYENLQQTLQDQGRVIEASDSHVPYNGNNKDHVAKFMGRRTSEYRMRTGVHPYNMPWTEVQAMANASIAQATAERERLRQAGPDSHNDQNDEEDEEEQEDEEEEETGPTPFSPSLARLELVGTVLLRTHIEHRNLVADITKYKRVIARLTQRRDELIAQNASEKQQRAAQIVLNLHMTRLYDMCKKRPAVESAFDDAERDYVAAGGEIEWRDPEADEDEVQDDTEDGERSSKRRKIQ